MSRESAVDLRSDTVTRPSARMREAMATAEVGDDTFGEDPTVNRLEARAAELTGMEKALFVPSGIMANEIALHVLAPAGSEVICEATSHIIQWEMAAMAVLSGLLPRPVAGRSGRMDPEDVESAINQGVSYRTPTGALSVENSTNMTGGTVYTRPQLAALLEVARRHRLPTHLDGARIFNAALALDVPVEELVGGFDVVMFCLSKGLGAPVGSMLCGSAEFISEAWRVRRMLGGGMRQSGILAAAGLVALDEGPRLLSADHRRARALAVALSSHPHVTLDAALVETNIVIFEVDDAQAWVESLEAKQVLVTAVGEGQVRLVTHRDVSDDDLAYVVAAIAGIAPAA